MAKGCKQSKLNVAMKKKLCIENRIGIIINMMIIFHFMFKMLKNPILKVELSRIFKTFLHNLLAQNVQSYKMGYM